MSLTPAHDEMKAREIREAIELCGRNRGPHDYIPIEWCQSSVLKGQVVEGLVMNRVTRFLCRVCFNSVDTKTLLDSYKDVSYQGK